MLGVIKLKLTGFFKMTHNFFQAALQRFATFCPRILVKKGDSTVGNLLHNPQWLCYSLQSYWLSFPTVLVSSLVVSCLLYHKHFYNERMQEVVLRHPSVYSQQYCVYFPQDRGSCTRLNYCLVDPVLVL